MHLTGLIIFTYIQNVLGEQTGEIIHDHLTVTQILPVLFSLDNFDVDLNFRLQFFHLYSHCQTNLGREVEIDITKWAT
jgi:hypothetical protein